MSKNEAKKLKTDNSSKVNKSEEKFDPSKIEQYWSGIWEEEGIYQPDLDKAKSPFFNLMMFPYPSAEGLHVGNCYAFTGADIYGRFKRMQGNDVFEPIGLDGFGIHSENYALKVGRTPQEHARISEENFYRQLHLIGNGFDWSRTVETYDPDYYKWTQWLFIQLFKAGLAYRKKSPVNWCPGCKTVLADEQVIEKSKIKGQKSKINKEEIIINENVGVCERCGTEVEKRDLEQWYFGITKYADRLLENIKVINWTEKVKIAQKQWIGKKTGIRIKYKISNFQFPISNFKYEVEVFTTRPDTNFGATFIALSPEYSKMDEILNSIQDKKAKAGVVDYIEKAKGKSEIERQTEGREKTGVFTGLYAINELTGYKMPIWVADFVLGGFGTGALVGVPGHDARDFEFAEKFGLEIKRVVVGCDGDKASITRIEQVQEENGNMVNSGFLDGMDIHKATEKIMDYMEEKGYGKRETTYHLRDWLISRQRYWGPPIPMIFCSVCAEKGISWFNTVEAKEKGKGMGISNDKFLPHKRDFAAATNIGNSGQAAGWFPVNDEDLPVLLPELKDWKPTGTGASPLAKLKDWKRVKCPNCGGDAERETDVSDNFLDDSWYFFRYIATDFNDKPFDKARVKKWLPVTMYIGGAEHSVLHLLYARFLTMALADMGYIDFEEPFRRFYAHGLIIKDGAKMSKSKGNVVVPDAYIKKFGADTLRTYLMFLGPFNQGGDFSDSGIEGMHRFLKRIWNLFQKEFPISNFQFSAKGGSASGGQISNERLRVMHGTIKGVTEDMENLRYNTAIAKLMTWYNFLSKEETPLRSDFAEASSDKQGSAGQAVSREEMEVYLKLLAPFAPFMTEELFQRGKAFDGTQALRGEGERVKGKFESIHVQAWPGYDPKYLEEDMVTIAVQVNGKMRDVFQDQRSKIKDQKYMEKLATESEKVSKYLEGKKVIKVIYVEGKILNFVVDEIK